MFFAILPFDKERENKQCLSFDVHVAVGIHAAHFSLEVEFPTIHGPNHCHS